MPPIITVENLSKRYILNHQAAQGAGGYRKFSDTLIHAATAPLRAMKKLKLGKQKAEIPSDGAQASFPLSTFNSPLSSSQLSPSPISALPGGSATESFWALKDVSFEIKQGEVVGIIGRNGAGKSTLLKILSRITEPTTGRITLRGRVASLLEVGTGFHPELTGRENIYLNGAILGMTKAEVRSKFDEIVAFAEVERFLDTPVKRYSSGMYVRLAFAVAAHLEPEILVVDEVLAVGDAEFQKKCLGKMGEVAKGGRTVLFVSHHLATIGSLCNSCIWLDRGGVITVGIAANVIREYQKATASNTDTQLELDSLVREHHYGEAVRITGIEWLSPQPCKHGEQLSAKINFHAIRDTHDVSFGIGFSTLSGTRLLTLETDYDNVSRPILRAGTLGYVEVKIDNLCLSPGDYTIDLGCRSGDAHCLDYISRVCPVRVCLGRESPSHIDRNSPGIRLSSKWSWHT